MPLQLADSSALLFPRSKQLTFLAVLLATYAAAMIGLRDSSLDVRSLTSPHIIISDLAIAAPPIWSAAIAGLCSTLTPELDRISARSLVAPKLAFAVFALTLVLLVTIMTSGELFEPRCLLSLRDALTAFGAGLVVGGLWRAEASTVVAVLWFGVSLSAGAASSQVGYWWAVGVASHTSALGWAAAVMCLGAGLVVNLRSHALWGAPVPIPWD